MDFSSFLEDNKISYETNVSLADKSWLRTGGVVSFYISPISVGQLVDVCRWLYAHRVEFDVIGYTSNIFFHSTYHPKVVVSTIRLNNYEIKDDIVICDCGSSVIKLAKDCLTKGFAGFYGLIGLPGTVASAVVNNAGCFKCSIASMLLSADVLLPDGTIQIFKKEDFIYTHRSSVFKRGEKKGVILFVKLKLQRSDNIEEEKRKAEKTKIYRERHQEGYKNNLGSVFAAKMLRHNVRNITIRVIVKVLKTFHIANFMYIKKTIVLRLYHYRNLNRYISDKNLNIFIWKDEFAEEAFDRYKQFMSKVYKDLEIEIEERI